MLNFTHCLGFQNCPDGEPILNLLRVLAPNCKTVGANWLLNISVGS